MADQIRYEKSDPSCTAMDYKAHEQTYGLFTGLVKWVIILSVLLLAFMAAFLT